MKVSPEMILYTTAPASTSGMPATKTATSFWTVPPSAICAQMRGHHDRSLPSRSVSSGLLVSDSGWYSGEALLGSTWCSENRSVGSTCLRKQARRQAGRRYKDGSEEH